ncbi:Cadmium/zinc-transporting ATPase HMA2 [Dendrobium catenatum]|uniref:Cadmium/zinc-transporting ATPase HMA2 n=3 Tax=Dendrobium catenatum TaxID=906689 RepID=A0A2I0VKH7_9ASPA|nr:Cadmium/zinc-transporting ATPase HMA2 [Dendrobium catenatum]
MANVGISMGVSGSAVAMETSHITLMSNDIQKIPKAIRLARRTQHKIITNIIFSIITKVSILGLAIGGHPLLWAAVLADVGTCLIVILNSMTLLPTNKKKVKKCCQRSNHQRPTCRDKCSKGPCGSNSANCHSYDGLHKTEEGKKPCCESPSESKECQAESPLQCCQGKVTCKAKTRYEHSIYMNCEKDSHRDDESCLNHSVREIKHTVPCPGFHLHKSKADHEEHNEHSPCEEHLSKQPDHGSHSHHESGKHEAESRHGHSDHDITCNLKINATKNCCNAFVDQTVGAGANLKASTICNGSETKTSDSCCESERKDCHGKHQCSNLLASKFKENGGCCRSYRKECSRRETCCGNGMMQVPEIIIE